MTSDFAPRTSPTQPVSRARMGRTSRARRGSVVIIVLWTISIAALAVSATQLLSYRQATVGRVGVERVQARWAARAGVEHTIALMAQHTQFPIPDDAFALRHDLELAAFGQFEAASYDLIHHYEGQDWAGPSDESSRLNINTVNSGILIELFDDITIDVADAITDWIDDDDDPGTLGVEGDYYLSLNPPYQPRNGYMRSVAELELVAGVWPEHLRGEDWNLNHRRDINEDDASRTLPVDNSDGQLDAGWSEFLTAYSIDNGPTISGLPRIWLRAAEPEALVERLGITDDQARSLIYFGRNVENRLEQLATVALNTIDDKGNAAQNVINPYAQPLTEEELQAVIDECAITDPLDRLPGRMNVNTVSPRLLRRIFEALGADEYIADEIIYLRDSRPEGIVSLLELQEVQDMTGQLWDTVAGMFTTTSSVYSISARGRAQSSDLEVEIIAVVDRSTVPVTIIEYREQ